MNEGFFFSTTSPTATEWLIIAILTGVKWYLIIVLICIFIIGNEIEHLLIWPFVYLLGRSAYQVLCPFFNWISCLVWSCMSSLYILDINSLSKLLFANILFYCYSIFPTMWDRERETVPILALPFSQPPQTSFLTSFNFINKMEIVTPVLNCHRIVVKLK